MLQNDKMIIGFDAKRIVSNATGLGSYGRTLVNDLSVLSPDMQLRLYAPDQGSDDLRNQVVLRDNVQLVYPENTHCRLQRDLWRTRGMVKDLRRDPVDIFHGLSGELPVGLKRAGIPGVVTIHDLIFLRHPEYYNWIDVQIYKRKFHQTLKEARRIIAISECTKRDILYYGDFPETSIDVIYQSCGTRFALSVSEDKMMEVHAKYDLPARYILNVGTVEERKNVLLAIKALRYMPEDMHIVIVGRPTKYKQKIDRMPDKDILSQRVHFLQGVPNDDLPAIYQMAEAFVYPSRYEGFGIPIIEAIQSGLPVVACKGSCLEEAGGPSCIYVDPDDERAMASAIVKVIEERELRVADGQEYIRRFENQDVASQVLSVYAQIRSEATESL